MELRSKVRARALRQRAGPHLASRRPAWDAEPHTMDWRVRRLRRQLAASAPTAPSSTLSTFQRPPARTSCRSRPATSSSFTAMTSTQRRGR
eukprot:10354516-Lingulodinium_polyedra.AAC.1